MGHRNIFLFDFHLKPDTPERVISVMNAISAFRYSKGNLLRMRESGDDCEFLKNENFICMLSNCRFEYVSNKDCYRFFGVTYIKGFIDPELEAFLDFVRPHISGQIGDAIIFEMDDYTDNHLGRKYILVEGDWGIEWNTEAEYNRLNDLYYGELQLT